MAPSVGDVAPDFDLRDQDGGHVRLSTDATPALKAWSEAEGFAFPLLADFWPHGEVARAYGVFNEAVGAAERGTFVIDTEGIVRYSVHNGLGEARDDEAYLDALRTIGAA